MRYLYISGSQLTSIPVEIAQLSDLVTLDLSENHLISLPVGIGRLGSLDELILSDNQLTSLPAEIGHLVSLERLALRDNLLPIPPEILDAEDDPARIINYYMEHLGLDKRPLNEAKMLVRGQGGVGKTSLVKALMLGEQYDPKIHFDPNESKTQGIDIQPWQVVAEDASIQLNVWDFGGQEIMHATHQFFLTKRSLYLLVLDARQGEHESRIEYWLKLIQSFGRDSPIIVVCNKSDEHELDLDWTGLQRKYPTIKRFVRKISCFTGEGIAELRSNIEGEVAKLEHIHDQLLMTWFTVKDQLESMKDDFISYEGYQRMCETVGIQDEVSQRTLIGFLHDLGVVLHYQDHPILEDTNILNPEWVTKAVYQILNSERLSQSRGVLEIRELAGILKPRRDYPRNKFPFIIGVMGQFELCFGFEDRPNEKFLVPDLLAREEPYTGEWEDSLAFHVYQYDVLPGSVMSRFIVRMSPFVRDVYWRNGDVLESPDGRNTALVKADIEDRTVFVFVTGNVPTRRDFLGVIKADLWRIHATVPRLEVRQMVPLPGQPEIVVDYDYLLDLEDLGEESFVPVGLKRRVDVKQLLDGIEPEEARLETSRAGGNQIINSERVYVMRDQYSAGQVGAQGPGAHAHDMSFTQIWNETRSSIDLPALALELRQLQEHMKVDASAPDHYSAIGEVVHAEQAAAGGDGPKVMQHLKSAGRRACSPLIPPPKLGSGWRHLRLRWGYRGPVAPLRRLRREVGGEH